MPRITHGDEMHRDAGGGLPFEEDPGDPGVGGRLQSGYSIVRSFAGDAYLVLNGDLAALSSGDDTLILSANQETPGGGNDTKIRMLGGHGLVIPILSADPAAGASEDGQIYYNDSTDVIRLRANGAWGDIGSGTGAPSTADYLVGTAQAGLSAEIVVGATPGGELGGTWAAPTVDATHSGSAHHTESHQARHANGGADEVAVEGLGTAETDTAFVLAPDGTGGVEFRAEAVGAGMAGELVTDTIIGDGVEDTFALSAAPTGTWALVSTNGADLLPSEYAIVAGDIVFDVAPANLAEVLVTFITGGFTGAAGDPGDIADPTLATAEDVALKLNALMANLRTAGIIA